MASASSTIDSSVPSARLECSTLVMLPTPISE
jgi:hypothetical protein